MFLRPLSSDNWELVREDIEAGPDAPAVAQGSGVDADLEAEDPSLYDITQALGGDGGVVLDAHREVRVKLYLGQVSNSIHLRPIFISPSPSRTCALTR